jgi:hypothetical protein
VLGGATLAKVQSTRSDCNPPSYTVCNTTGTALINDARNLQTGAFVALGVGAAATITGVVLWVTAPKATAAPTETTEKAAWVEVTPLGLSLRGAW